MGKKVIDNLIQPQKGLPIYESCNEWYLRNQPVKDLITIYKFFFPTMEQVIEKTKLLARDSLIARMALHERGHVGSDLDIDSLAYNASEHLLRSILTDDFDSEFPSILSNFVDLMVPGTPILKLDRGIRYLSFTKNHDFELDRLASLDFWKLPKNIIYHMSFHVELDELPSKKSIGTQLNFHSQSSKFMLYNISDFGALSGINFLNKFP